VFLFSLIRAIWPAHLILFYLIILLKLGEEYKSRSSSLCNFLHSQVTSSLFGPNIFLSILFSNTLSLCSSFNVRHQVSRPYRKTGKIIVFYKFYWSQNCIENVTSCSRFRTTESLMYYSRKTCPSNNVKLTRVEPKPLRSFRNAFSRLHFQVSRKLTICGRIPLMVKVNKAIPVTGRGGLGVCEMLKIPHC
jgi:hypothetical protein